MCLGTSPACAAVQVETQAPPAHCAQRAAARRPGIPAGTDPPKDIPGRPTSLVPGPSCPHLVPPPPTHTHTLWVAPALTWQLKPLVWPPPRHRWQPRRWHCTRPRRPAVPSARSARPASAPAPPAARRLRWAGGKRAGGGAPHVVMPTLVWLFEWWLFGQWWCDWWMPGGALGSFLCSLASHGLTWPHMAPTTQLPRSHNHHHRPRAGREGGGLLAWQSCSPGSASQSSLPPTHPPTHPPTSIASHPRLLKPSRKGSCGQGRLLPSQRKPATANKRALPPTLTQHPPPPPSPSTLPPTLTQHPVPHTRPAPSPPLT